MPRRQDEEGMTYARRCPTRLLAVALIFAAISASAAPSGEEAQWIWSKEQAKGPVPANSTCYFRRTFALKSPESGSVTIGADDAYELFVNGQKMASGSG